MANPPPPSGPSAVVRPTGRVDRDDEDDDRTTDVSSDLSVVGRVTYLGVDGSVPVARRWSLTPSAAVLHIASQDGGDSELHFYGGGGGVYDWSDAVHLSAGVEASPSSAGVSSMGGQISVEVDCGSDWNRDRPPWLELSTELSGVHTSLPSAASIDQYFLALSALVRVGDRWEFAPEAMYFLYGRALAISTPEQADALAVLARVGTYAPQVMLGLGGVYRLTAWLGLAARGEHIAYAGGVGHAAGGMLGVDLRSKDRLHVGALVGALRNSLSAALDGDSSARTVPLVSASATLSW